MYSQLKHTYLRVLHPLLINTQLRLYPYKRPQLRRVLKALISKSHYRECDPTTRRLVERNLRGSWCEGLHDDSVGDGEKRSTGRKGSAGSEGMGTGWSSGMGGSRSALEDPSLRTRIKEGTVSSASVDAIAQAQDIGISKVRRRSIDGGPLAPPIIIGGTPAERTLSGSSSLSAGSPLSNSVILEIPTGVQRPTTNLTDSPPTTPSSLSSSMELPNRRRRPPPPPTPSSPARPRTPSTTHLAATYATGAAAAATIQLGGPPPIPREGGRRAAPAPPVDRDRECGRREGATARERAVARGLEEEMERRLRELQVDG